MAYPATFLTIQDAVINKLRLDAADRAKTKDWINQIYAQVCVETEALQKADTMTTTLNVGSYLLPTQVLRMKEIVAAAASSSTSYGIPLEQVSLDEILTLRQASTSPATNSGTSSKYALAGLTQLELWPTPAAVDTLLMYYVYLPTALTNDGDVPVLQEPFASKMLEYGALAEGADFLSDPDQDRYRTLYEDWLRRFRTHLNRRRGGGVGQMRVMGERLVTVGRDIDLGY